MEGDYRKPWKTLVKQGGNREGRNRLRDENSEELSQRDERSRVPALSHLKYENGKAVGPGGRIIFARSFRIRVLEFLTSGGSKQRAMQEFKLTHPQLQRILDGEGGAGKPKPSVIKLEQAIIKEKTLRDQLYQKAVDATAAALDFNDDYRRGVIGVKVLEGLGDFRRAGDEIPREVPRQPLFNLPPGSHVAIEIRTSGELPTGNMPASSITTKEVPALEGETNGSNDRSAINYRDSADPGGENGTDFAEGGDSDKENRSPDEGMETAASSSPGPDSLDGSSPAIEGESD